MHSWLLIPLLLSAPAGETPAAVQAPYQLVVCLRAAEDPLLTPQFLVAVQREVRDQLRSFLGPLCQVQVLTSEHWLVDEYRHEDVDLPFVDAEILAGRGMVEQAFVFRIDQELGRYHVHWRMIDGATGQVGPVGTQETPDRQWVGKAICLAVRRDFAIRAEVIESNISNKAQLNFVGREYPEYLKRLLGARSALRPYWVFKTRDGTVRREIPSTLVLWENGGQLAAGTVESNLTRPWQQRPGLMGFEAVRIPTQPGRLRLRFVDRDSGRPIYGNVTVWANDAGFQSLQNADILPPVTPQGVVFPAQVLQHVAYVRVTHGGATLNLPVPITQAVCEQVVTLMADKNASSRADYDRDLRYLSQDIQNISALQTAAARSATELHERKRYEDALKGVEANVSSVGPLLDNAGSLLAQLQETNRRLQFKDEATLERANTSIQGLASRNQDLLTLKDSLRNAIETRDAQARADVLIKLGNQAELDADFDEAITRYGLALGEQPNQPALQDKLDRLQEQWRIKDPTHEAARLFVTEKWAQAEVTEIETLLPEAERVLTTLRTYGDSLTALRLLKVNDQHVVALNDVIGQLSARNTEEDREETAKIAAVLEKLATFQGQVAQFISDSATPETEAPPQVDPPPNNPADPDTPPPQDKSDSDSPPPGPANSLLDLGDKQDAPPPGSG